MEVQLHKEASSAYLVDELENEHKKQVRSPVAQSEIEAEILLEVREIELTYGSDYIEIGLCDDLLSSLEEDHEVSHVVAPALDRGGGHFNERTAIRGNAL